MFGGSILLTNPMLLWMVLVVRDVSGGSVLVEHKV